ncbi:hypothetical protein Tco_1299942 [Tanacetum coccineum]
MDFCLVDCLGGGGIGGGSGVGEVEGVLIGVGGSAVDFSVIKIGLFGNKSVVELEVVEIVNDVDVFDVAEECTKGPVEEDVRLLSFEVSSFIVVTLAVECLGG